MLLTEILVTAYGFVVGACVGSFLNVVAWRLPLGMSLIRPASHCPRCKTPIRPRDNVPVLGWLLLRGRCRSCGTWISPRYPLVEFAVGAAFALLAWRELASAGGNLPPRADVWRPIAAGLPFDWVYFGLWLYHATLISILATIALAEFDGQRLTRGFLIFVLCAGLAPPLILPELRVTFTTRLNAAAWMTEATLQQALQYMMFGVVLGTCIAWSFDPRYSQRARLIPMAVAMGAAGMFLGEAAVYLIGCMVAIALLVLRMLRNIGFAPWSRHSSSAFVALSTLVTIVLWPTLRGMNRNPEMGEKQFQLFLILAICAVTAVLSVVGKRKADGAAANDSGHGPPA